MKFIAKVNVMPRKGLLDPQGKAVANSLHNIGFTGVNEVNVGKHIVIQLTAASEDEAKAMAEDACKRLLANQIMEAYEIAIEKAD